MVESEAMPIDQIERLSLFFPIKVVNGFVTCDFKLGCYCCKFCLNRRHPDWHRLLEMNKIYRNTLRVEEAAGLLKRVKALTHAGATLKIGHDTDMSLEESEAQQLVSLMPDNQPIVFMRRGILLPQHKPFYMKNRRNLLVELTITPRSRYLEYSTDPYKILQSFEGVACSMFYTIGPVCEDNFDEAKEIIRLVPPGSKVWVRDLIVKDIPKIAPAGPVNYRGEELREYAQSLGHDVIHYLNCVVRAELGLPFHKRGEFVSEPNIWQMKWAEKCKVREVCGRELPEEEEQRDILSALDDLALSLAKPLKKFGHKSYAVVVNEEVNFGDECYIRELTRLKVDLWKEGKKTGTALSPSIAARWKQVDFFPVDDMLQLAQESFRLAFG